MNACCDSRHILTQAVGCPQSSQDTTLTKDIGGLQAADRTDPYPTLLSLCLLLERVQSSVFTTYTRFSHSNDLTRPRDAPSHFAIANINTITYSPTLPSHVLSHCFSCACHYIHFYFLEPLLGLEDP